MEESLINEYLQDGLEEEGTIEGAFDYLLDTEIREVFEMNNWDEPKFTERIIKFRGVSYNIKIKSAGIIEQTWDGIVRDWKWSVNAL